MGTSTAVGKIKKKMVFYCLDVGLICLFGSQILMLLLTIIKA